MNIVVLSFVCLEVITNATKIIHYQKVTSRVLWVSVAFVVEI